MFCVPFLGFVFRDLCLYLQLVGESGQKSQKIDLTSSRFEPFISLNDSSLGKLVAIQIKSSVDSLHAFGIDRMTIYESAFGTDLRTCIVKT